MNIGDVRLKVVFFRTGSGTEPVRRWLKSLSSSYKKAIGEDIKTVQFGWPLGMPLVEKIEPYLWEVGAADKAAIQLGKVQPCQLLVSDT